MSLGECPNCGLEEKLTETCKVCGQTVCQFCSDDYQGDPVCDVCVIRAIGRVLKKRPVEKSSTGSEG